jgi:hypothetical protein
MAIRRQSRYSFDHVLKRSPRLTRAASSRITSGVRRMTRVVPCRPRRYREWARAAGPVFRGGTPVRICGSLPGSGIGTARTAGNDAGGWA